MATTTIPAPPTGERGQPSPASGAASPVTDPGSRGLALSEFSVKSPSIPIPFHRLLKVVALVDREDAQTRQLLDRIGEEKFEVEVSGRYDRDVSEDADVGAYIISIDGDRREPASSSRCDSRRRRGCRGCPAR